MMAQFTRKKKHHFGIAWTAWVGCRTCFVPIFEAVIMHGLEERRQAKVLDPETQTSHDFMEKSHENYGSFEHDLQSEIESTKLKI